MGRTPRVNGWFAAVAVSLALGLVVLVALGLAGRLFDADDLLTWGLAFVAIFAVAGWWQDRLAQGERDAVERARREREDGEERRRTDRLERALVSNRRWAQQLRDHLARMHRERGPLGGGGDVREMVLKTAVELVEADRGILLSRRDADGDGNLDTVCHVGFSNDPTGSAVAQEFAGRVLGRDETVREDDSRSLRAEARTPADEEIDNLLAIPIFIQEDFSGVVLCANREGGFEELDDDVLLALGDHAGAVLENGRLEGEMRSTYISIVRMLAEAIEAKDPTTRMHSEEVAAYVAAVADRLELDPHRREELVIASLLHDVGKIGISERILLKPGALTPEERDAVELHARIGFRLVQQVPALGPIGPAVLHHHERFDGGGYPNGLAGEEIPLEARVVCVADCFSAMTSKRPYRTPMSIGEACEELERCAGTHFDPRVVELFVDEVRSRPAVASPAPGDGLDSALDEDPEVRARRNGDEPVLGYGPVGAVDSLTLLSSLRRMHDRAAAEAVAADASGTPFSVLLVELSDLAAINARDGYAAGDRALVDAAHVVDQSAVQVGGTACRHGGGRLAVIAPATTLERAVELARELEQRLALGPATVRTSVAVWEHGEPADAVISRARMGLALAEARPA